MTECLTTFVGEMRDLKKDIGKEKRETKSDTLTKLANRKAFEDMLAKLTLDSNNSGTEGRFILVL